MVDWVEGVTTVVVLCFNSVSTFSPSLYEPIGLVGGRASGGWRAIPAVCNSIARF